MKIEKTTSSHGNDPIRTYDSRFETSDVVATLLARAEPTRRT